MVSTEALERVLARRGFRVTRPRRTLLRAMASLGDHFTAQDLMAAVAPQEVGRATVFRTIRLLQDMGTLCQVVLDDGTVEYRLTSGGHHHHVVCSQCGAVRDFASCDIDGLLAEIGRLTGFAVQAHRLELYGHCERCRTAAPAPPAPAVPVGGRAAR